jgi:hypothetical protein
MGRRLSRCALCLHLSACSRQWCTSQGAIVAQHRDAFVVSGAGSGWPTRCKDRNRTTDRANRRCAASCGSAACIDLRILCLAVQESELIRARTHRAWGHDSGCGLGACSGRAGLFPAGPPPNPTVHLFLGKGRFGVDYRTLAAAVADFLYEKLTRTREVRSRQGVSELKRSRRSPGGFGRTGFA